MVIVQAAGVRSAGTILFLLPTMKGRIMAERTLCILVEGGSVETNGGE